MDRTIVPYLRGYGKTHFLSPNIRRSGQQAALGKDLQDLMNALEIDKAILVGYDWGGRAALYCFCTLARASIGLSYYRWLQYSKLCSFETTC